MKKVTLGALILCSSLSVAANHTDLGSKWICTTNASSSNVGSEKAADDIMTIAKGSAVNSFNYATKNCRNCTKITCEVND